MPFNEDNNLPNWQVVLFPKAITAINKYDAQKDKPHLHREKKGTDSYQPKYKHYQAELLISS
ncbi:MAG: hypothetical protein PHX63_01340 [Eubacteriales bacterium]|nr:hypothetical protein [Eubacteriales bacterium]